MTDSEKNEHLALIKKWDATDITPAQNERLEQLDALAAVEHHIIPESARFDREDIIFAAGCDLRAKYDHGQREHNTDLPTAGLGWFARAAREEALDLIAYTHHLRRKVEALHDLQQRMASGEISMTTAAEELFTLISETPPKKNDEAHPLWESETQKQKCPMDETQPIQRNWWVNVYPDGRIASSLCPTREAAMTRSTYTGETPDAAQVEVTLHIVKRPNDEMSRKADH